MIQQNGLSINISIEVKNHGIIHTENHVKVFSNMDIDYYFGSFCKKYKLSANKISIRCGFDESLTIICDMKPEFLRDFKLNLIGL